MQWRWLNKLDEKCKNKFKNTFKFSNNDFDEFILLLRNGVYPIEYMDGQEKFNQTTLPEKKEFCSNLNMEKIADSHYMDGRRFCKDFDIKCLGECHALYLKIDALLLADVFENLKKCI